MKHFLKTTLLLLAILLPATAVAYMIDDINYDFTENENEVILSHCNKSYTGDLVIPSTVTIHGLNYVVTSISRYAFTDCSFLTSIYIPESITYIDDTEFSGCNSLTSICVDNDNPNYDSRDNCNAIIETFSNTLIAGCKNTIIPNSVTAIDSNAFYCCTNLTSIEIPSSVTYIGGNAFGGCSALSSIQVESGNSNYDSRDNCNSIIETTTNTLIAGCMNTVIPNSVTSIGDFAFCSCSSLTSIDIPNSVTSIGEMAFADCSGLTSVIIPNSVTSISQWAFEGCSSLTSVTIPNSVTSIGEYAFFDCLFLNDICSYIINPSTVTMGSHVFTKRSSIVNRTLHVPSNTLATYQSATGWIELNYYDRIVEMPHDGDMDCDGTVTVSDVVTTIDVLLGGQSNYIQDYHADIDGNGELTILDITALIEILLSASN